MIKTQLEGAKGIWPDELPGILWAYRTTVRTPIGETPFCLTYGQEVVILAEVGITNHRVYHHDEGRNKEGMHLQLDLLDEVRTEDGLLPRPYSKALQHQGQASLFSSQ